MIPHFDWMIILAEKRFALAVGVNVRVVKEIYAQIAAVLDIIGNGALLEVVHSHAAQSDNGHHKVGVAKFYGFHVDLL